MATAVGIIVACDDDPVAPELQPPTNVAATQVSPTSIRVTWTAASGATSYLVHRAPGAAGGTFTRAGAGPVAGTTFTDADLAPGTYRYRVASVRANDTSEFSTVQTTTTTETFTAALNGDNERPTPRTTPATGTADITFRNDTIRWTIDLTQITNVSAAHIHTGGAEVSAGIILNLAGADAPAAGYSSSGVSNTQITGYVTRAGFVAPQPPNAGVTFDSLLVLMRNGNSYVNVHTNLTTNDPVNNTGPGDFPAGEIRGQVIRD